MKGNINSKIKCPFCKKKIQVNNYSQHIKSDKCKNSQNKKINENTFRRQAQQQTSCFY